jgi:hypothetical protein
MPLESRKAAQAEAAGSYSIAQGGLVGRTIPSFRIALAQEEVEWRAYRQYLGKKERRAFDGMFAIPRLYISACSGAVKPVRLFPIIMSILFHHYLELIRIAQSLEVKLLA